MSMSRWRFRQWWYDEGPINSHRPRYLYPAYAARRNRICCGLTACQPRRLQWVRGITRRSDRPQARADWLCSGVRYVLSRYSLCWLAVAVVGCTVSDGVGSRRWHPANDRARLGLCAADGPRPPRDSDDRGRRDRLYGRRMTREPGCALSRLAEDLRGGWCASARDCAVARAEVAESVALRLHRR